MKSEYLWSILFFHKVSEKSSEMLSQLLVPNFNFFLAVFEFYLWYKCTESETPPKMMLSLGKIFFSFPKREVLTYHPSFLTFSFLYLLFKSPLVNESGVPKYQNLCLRGWLTSKHSPTYHIWCFFTPFIVFLAAVWDWLTFKQMWSVSFTT